MTSKDRKFHFTFAYMYIRYQSFESPDTVERSLSDHSDKVGDRDSNALERVFGKSPMPKPVLTRSGRRVLAKGPRVLTRIAVPAPPRAIESSD